MRMVAWNCWSAARCETRCKSEKKRFPREAFKVADKEGKSVIFPSLWLLAKNQ